MTLSISASIERNGGRSYDLRIVGIRNVKNSRRIFIIIVVTMVVSGCGGYCNCIIQIRCIII
jgi:hypothetical protein